MKYYIELCVSFNVCDIRAYLPLASIFIFMFNMLDIT